MSSQQIKIYNLCLFLSYYIPASGVCLILTWLYLYFITFASVEDTGETVRAFEVEERGDRENEGETDQQSAQKDRGCYTRTTCQYKENK